MSAWRSPSASWLRAPVRGRLAADTYQVRLVATPVKNTTPSFVSALRRLPGLDRLVQGRLQDVRLRPRRRPERLDQPRPGRLVLQPGRRGRLRGVPGGHHRRLRRHLPLRHRQPRQSRHQLRWAWTGDRNDWNPRIQGGEVVWREDSGRSRDRVRHLPVRHSAPATRQEDPRRHRVPRPRHLGRLRGLRQGRGLRRGSQRQRRSSSTTSATGGDHRHRRHADKNNEHPRIDGEQGRVVQRRHLDARHAPTLDHHLPDLPLRHRAAARPRS